jgi:hypothetical protein
MGYNIKMLDERCAEKGEDEEHSARLELEECIHFHMDAMRLVFTTQDFLKLADMFTSSAQKVREMGEPETLDKMVQLGRVWFDHPCMHNDRIATEITKDGTIHTHHKNLRIHMPQADFYEWADGIRDSILGLSDFLRTTIDITDPNVIYHPIVEHHMTVLSDQTWPEIMSADPEEVGELKKKMKWYLSHPMGDETTEADLQRPSGRLPARFPGDIPEELDRQYLFALRASIEKYGYAKGPFIDDLMPAYRYTDGRIYLKGAHRTAVLLSLGYTKIDVALSEPTTSWEEG